MAEAREQPQQSSDAGTLPRPLPVFPWDDRQVQEVADALAEKLHWLRDEQRADELARVALKAAARVMRLEREDDPQGAPRGYGWRQIRGVTEWFTVAPDGTWAP